MRLDEILSNEETKKKKHVNRFYAHKAFQH